MAPQGLICPKMEKYGDISVKKCDFIEVYPRFLVHSTKNLYKEKTGTRGEIWGKKQVWVLSWRDLREDKESFYKRGICYILMLSLAHTYKDERSSWSARVALQLSGRYEPYRLICRWLNVKRPGRCAPWGAQGVDTAYGNSYKGQTFRQQTGSLWGFLSDFRENISMLSFNKRMFHIPPLQSGRLCTASSRRLADLWAFAHTDLRSQEGFAQTANIVCGSLICLFSSSLACSILASVFSAPTAANTGSRLFYILNCTPCQGQSA